MSGNFTDEHEGLRAAIKDLLHRRLGEPASAESMVTVWKFPSDIIVVWEPRVTIARDTVLWLSCHSGITPCICYAEHYASSAIRPEHTYHAPTLAQGKPALRFLPQGLEEVEMMLDLIDSLRGVSSAGTGDR